jgi:hypothetical protein
MRPKTHPYGQTSLKIELRDPKYDPLTEVAVKIGGKKVADVKGIKRLKKGITRLTGNAARRTGNAGPQGRCPPLCIGDEPVSKAVLPPTSSFPALRLHIEPRSGSIERSVPA